MQHEAALFLPPAITGSHVGPRTCHSSGRILPMSFRARVAAQRHMGFEMDPQELTEAEAATLRRVTDWWKATRGWRLSGDTIPLDSHDPAVTSEIQIAADGSRFVLFAGRHATSAQTLPRPQQLAGLEPEATYRLSLLNPEDRPPQGRGTPAILDGPMKSIRPPPDGPGPASAVVLAGDDVDGRGGADPAAGRPGLGFSVCRKFTV